MKDSDIFKQYIDSHYEAIKQHLIAFCLHEHYTWDEDIYHDTLLKCIDLIERKGLKDTSDKGIENYLFMAYKTNTMRERQYCRVTRRDKNITDINGAYEDYLSHRSSADEKVMNDLYVDFSAMYLASSAEGAMMDGHITAEEYHLWRFKTFLPYLTYDKLENLTRSKGVRGKVKRVRQWLKENISIDAIDESFKRNYMFT